MTTTTLLSQTFGAQAVFGEYAGGETVLHFGSPAGELRHLRHGCALFDLSWRGKLVVSGEDRVRWLNGMVSNNTRDLPPNSGNFSFVLNTHGHIQADLLAFQRGDYYLLETEAGEMASLRELFERYIIMDDVEIEDISQKLVSIGVAGPRALEVLREAGLLGGESEAPLKPGQVLDAVWHGRGFSLVRDPVSLRDWYELWLAPENMEFFWSHLISAGAAPAGAEALEQQRILLGLPRAGRETGVRELLQETGQDYALHSAKGCYIGQEIVERVRSRGQVNRLLMGLLFEDAAAPATRGSELFSGESAVGTITSSAVIVLDGVPRSIALAYLKRSAAAAGTSLRVEGRSAQVMSLPFVFAEPNQG